MLKIFGKKTETPAASETPSMPSNSPTEEWGGGEAGAATEPAPAESEAPTAVKGPPEPMQCSGPPRASDWHPAHGRFPKGIPSSYGRLLTLELELWGAEQKKTTPAVRAEIHNLHAEIAAIKRHIAKLQNPPSNDTGDVGDGYRQFYMDRPIVGPGMRAARLEKLLVFLADLGNPDGHGLKFPVVADLESAAPKARLLATPEIQSQIVAALRASACVEVFRIDRFGPLNPTLRAEEIRVAIMRCSDLEQLKLLKEELRSINGEEGRIGRSIARVAQEKASEPAVLELQRLLALARSFVSEYQLEAIDQETEYLEQSGLPWSPTEKSKRYGALLAELKAMSPEPSLLDWFGYQLPA